MSNSFERFAQTQMVAATKAKHKAAETRERNRQVKVVQSEKDAPMKLSPLEQAMEDSSKQFRAYAKSKRAEVQAMLDGPDGEHWRALLQHLKGMTIEDGDALVAYIRKQEWLLDSDRHSREMAISVIGGAIINLRIRNGYSPMDDSIFDEPPTVFEIIRTELRVMTA
jgi:hypothetical protein